LITLTTGVTYAGSSLVCAGAGAVYDVSSHRIPNFLTLPAIVFGLVLHLMLGGWRQLLSAAAAGLLCGLIFLLFYLVGGMGAGDVKLITALGCISGLSLVGPLLFWTSLSGGVMALAFAMRRRRLKETVHNVISLVAHHSTQGVSQHPSLNLANPYSLRMPYALAIGTGSALTLCLLLVKG
jgi:prepilin peptidase CpaA